MPEYRIKPGGMHEKFMRSVNKIQIIGGGFGNGKTAASCVKAITLARDYPGSNGIIAMATYAQLNDTIREEFFKWVPASSVKRWPTIADNTLIFKNGSKVNFRYLQQKGRSAADGQTSSNLLSATYDWAVVDQIENPAIMYKDFLDLLGRLRGSTPYKGTSATMPVTGPRWLILAANPSFNWVFHKLIKPMAMYKKNGEIHPDLIIDVDTEKPLIDLFEASTYENKHNLEDDFIKTLEAAYTGQFRDRYLGGEWGAFEGLVYPDFDLETHTLPKRQIEAYLFQSRATGMKFKALEGFDFGIASPSCYLLGFVDHIGRVFILDGFYKPNMSLKQIGDEKIRLRAMYEPYLEFDDPINADPAIFKRTIVNGTGKGSETIKDVLTESHELFYRAGQNDVLNGIAKVTSYLAVNDFPNLITGEMNGPLIYFSTHLSWMFDEFGSYFWKTNGGLERIDIPIDKNDHSMDTLKYMFSYIPEAADLMYSSVMFNQTSMTFGKGTNSWTLRTSA
jgi:hypothetical protein